MTVWRSFAANPGAAKDWEAMDELRRNRSVPQANVNLARFGHNSRLRSEPRALAAIAALLLTVVLAASGCGRGASVSTGNGPLRRNGEILFGAGHSQLYLMRPDGTHQRPLTSVPPGTSGVGWSPDGKRIAYSRLRNATGTQCDLYVMNTDGTHVRRLRHDGWCSDDPAWSPDGRRLAFVRRHPGANGKTSIWTMNVGGTDLRQVTHGYLDLNPAWSPDGTTIAFVNEGANRLDQVGIWLVDPDGGNERQLTTRDEDAGPDWSPDGEGGGPDWSPDGEWIAFSRQDGEYQSSVSGSTRFWVDICVSRPDGGDLRRLTKHAGENVAPAWSPDGKRIVFTSDRAHDEQDLYDVYVMSADGTRQERLTRRGAGALDWGPAVNGR